MFFFLFAEFKKCLQTFAEKNYLAFKNLIDTLRQ